MPLSGGTSGAHDDAMHQGNAKRDVVGGVGGLDASGFLLAKGAGIAFPRTGSDDVHIYERTSGEEAYAFHRTGADDYTFYIKESNVWKRFQTESMKDVANGIAGLDASVEIPMALLKTDVLSGVPKTDAAGRLLLLGAVISLTRDINEKIYLKERTTDEYIFIIERLGVHDYLMKVRNGGSDSIVQLANMKDVANGIAGLDANAMLVSDRIGVGSQSSQHITKIASDVLRNSHDAAIGCPDYAYTKLKTITLSDGIKGVLRFKMTLYSDQAAEDTFGKWYKNGVALGAQHITTGPANSDTWSEDLDVGEMQAGETLEFWGYGSTGNIAYHMVSDCRLYYDNEPLIAVDSANS